MPKTVITVDDSMSIRETVKMILASAGYQVLTAEDGVKGLQICQQQKADLILSDLNMPNMDGMELTRQARALPACRFVPIILLTTESQTAKKLEARAAGATGWIVKPFTPEQLIAVIAKVLR